MKQLTSKQLTKNNKTMKMKEHYEAPSMEVVELKLQDSLLAGSNEQNGSFDRDATLIWVEDDWE